MCNKMCNAQNFVQQDFSLLPLSRIDRLVFLLVFPIRSPRKLGSHLHTGTAWGIAPTTLRWGLTDLGKFRGQRTQKIASISSAHLKWTVLSVGK
jgi:hypothetical protein